MSFFEQCQSVTSLMAGFNKTWFIAGGWAIDTFIGKETREHKDDLEKLTDVAHFGLLSIKKTFFNSL